MNEHNHLLDFILQLADNNLILGHRLSETCGHGPVLEQDIAITNIALDLIGQARALYQIAAKVEGKGNDEDHFAYFRDVWQFKNVLLVEQPNTDFGHIIVRQFLYDVFHRAFVKALLNSNQDDLKAYAEKSLKEIKYHYKYSSEWMLRLGDGTAESNQRMQVALDQLWPFYGEVFVASDCDTAFAKEYGMLGIEEFRGACDEEVKAILKEANLTIPENTWKQAGGKSGAHTEYLGFILADMQFLQRSYPGNTW